MSCGRTGDREANGGGWWEYTSSANQGAPPSTQELRTRLDATGSNPHEKRALGRFGSLALFRAAELKRCLKIGKPGAGGEGQEMAPGEGRRGPPGASRGCEVSSRGS